MQGMFLTGTPRFPGRHDQPRQVTFRPDLVYDNQRILHVLQSPNSSHCGISIIGLDNVLPRAGTRKVRACAYFPSNRHAAAYHFPVFVEKPYAA
jgi:hypothetical protein